ncbi:MAG: S8 family peptidase [Anaerolineales bacterium]|nr:S8 family peptidase [Anaerolineales bacterium]
MRKTRSFFNGVIILFLLLAALGGPINRAKAGDDPPKADPRLLQMAEENPEARFMVIVQKEAENKDLKDMEVEDEVLKNGGNIIKSLDMIAGFSAEMKGGELLKLAGHEGVHWISIDSQVFLAGGFDSNTFRDEFNSIGYNGTTGTNTWMLTWKEVGESDGATKGKVTVVTSNECAAGNCLRIGGGKTSISGRGIYRPAPLALVTSATLTFDTRVKAISSTNGTVSVQVSPDNGNSWITLDIFSMKASDSGQVARTYDISPYATAFTRVRFVGEGTVNGYLHVDNVQIEYSRLANAYIRSVLANNVWTNNSAPGEGITVAVVDSGLVNHLDLTTNSASRIVASVDFTRDANFVYSRESMTAEAVVSHPSSGLESQTSSETGLESQAMVTLSTGEEIAIQDIGYDDYGHGTHVAGIIGGAGQSSEGARIGNAPAVNLVNVKVTGADGSGYLSDLIYGLQWIYENRAAYNIRVVNISMNSATPESYHSSPVDAAVEILWFNGIVVVVSAGNNGTGSGPVELLPPANDPFVITVGATDDMGTPWLFDDAIANFSAYGTTEDGYAKPDLVAPGRNIISLLASTNSTVYVEHPDHRVDDNYFRMSGTSMSAPMVTAAVVLMLQRNPNLNPDQVKYRLMATSNSSWAGYDHEKAGSGYLNTFAAVMGDTIETANTGIPPSQMLTTGSDPITWGSAGWNSAGWNSAGWNSVNWDSIAWSSAGWNSAGWNTDYWDP